MYQEIKKYKNKKLKLDVLPVVHEAFQSLIGKGVGKHLFENASRNRCNICAHARCVEHMQRMPDAGYNDLRGICIDLRHGDDCGDHVHAVVTNIIKPANKR